MTTININDYVLVKDKDGQLKYYKDGQFYSIDEIESQVKRAEEKTEEKKAPIDLKPVLTLEQKITQKPELKPLDTKEEVEEINVNDDLNQRRTEDQKVIEEKVQYIIDKLKIQFSDNSIKQRFVNIMTTYFRGIRKIKEIEYILTLPKVSGGMELPTDKVSVISSILKHHNEDLHKQRRDITTKVIEPVIPLDHRLEPPPPVPLKYSPPRTTIAFQPKPKTMVKPMISKPTGKNPEPTSKPQVQDVQLMNRQLTGPLEELQYMTLEDFRRLGRNKEEIKAEVIERIMLLKEESLVKKLQGIKAWKSSPVFKLYLNLSLRGIQEKKTIEQLIEDSQRKNEEMITLSEYEIISVLNQELSY